MLLNRYEWLIKTITFRDHNTVRADFFQGRFAHMRWFLTEFEKYARKYYRHTEFVVIDETLRNFYALYSCDLKVYMTDKPGRYGLLFPVLADAKDRYSSRVIPYVTPLSIILRKIEMYLT